MEPNRKYQPDIEPNIRPDLRNIQGGGESTPERGNLSAVPNSTQDLANAEKQGNAGEPSSNVTPIGINQREAQGDKGAANDFKSTFTGEKGNGKKKLTRVQFWRRTGIFGGGGIIGIAIAIISGVTPLGGLLLNLGEVATVNRDSQSNVLTRRLYRVIDMKMTTEVTSGSCNVVKVACRFSRPTNAFLSRLDDYGIKALNADGSAIEKTKIGYPNAKPTSYTFVDSSGKTVAVNAKDFVSTLRSNAEFRKAFTTAYNMRYIGYADSYIKNLFYKPLGIDRTGKTTNTIDDEDPEKTLKNIAEGGDKDNKVRAATTPEEKNNAARTAINEAVEAEAESATKKFTKSGSDPVILAGTIACTAINAPGFFTKVSRLYQMRQEILLASTLILTASSMVKTGEIDPATMATIGALLTATVLLPDGTQSKSAMDSFGIKSILFNDTKSSSNNYKRFIPGYSALTATKGITEFAQNPVTKSTCDTIYSPQAQIAATTIEAGIGAATGGIGAVAIAVMKAALVGGGAILGAEAISGFIAQGVQSLFALIPPETIAAVLGNEDIANAKNEDLGDVFGGGLSFFFSNSLLSTGGGVLTTAQLAKASNDNQSYLNDYAEEERIGKSPFDISSPYTFLGSIAASYYTNAYVPNNIAKNALSSLGYLFTQPFKQLSTSTFATTNNLVERCSNAAEFGVDSAVAVGPYGELCTDIPSEFTDEPVSSVLTSVQGQYDEDSGLPTEDGEIQEVLDMCGEGDLLTAKGCTIEDQERANKSIYMVDVRLSDMLDDREYPDEPDAAGDTAAATGAIVLPIDPPYSSAGGTFGPRKSPCRGCSSWHVGFDFQQSAGKNVYAMSDGVVIGAGEGKNVITSIQHADGLVTKYFHESAILVKKGDVVKAGQVIGKVGQVGDATGDHLHFELDISKVTDPSVYSKYTKNAGGFSPAGTRIDPYQFFQLNGVPGI